MIPGTAYSGKSLGHQPLGLQRLNGFHLSKTVSKANRSPRTVLAQSGVCRNQDQSGRRSFKLVRTASTSVDYSIEQPVVISEEQPSEDVPQIEEDESLVITTFRWPKALAGKNMEIAVTGSFIGWGAPVLLTRSSVTGDYVVSLALPPGTYEYKYVIDKKWLNSPCEPVTADKRGRMNNQRTVAASSTLRWREEGKKVFVTGDFNSWGELIPLKEDRVAGGFSVDVCLIPGHYAYQFLVDNEWMTSPSAPVLPDEKGCLCNQVTVEATPAFNIFYATGWPTALIKFRVLGADGIPFSEEWQEMPLSDTQSRSTPQNGRWKMTTISAPDKSAQLEFSVSDGLGQVDTPEAGASYRCYVPGGFKLQRGQMKPFPQVLQAPIMVVSDLDGTMVGNGVEADSATWAFSNYWEENAALVGSVLVYNTGRSLGQFIGLHQEKGGALALPDALITAVGTKIFLLDSSTGSRGTAGGSSWKEDLHWAARLDEDWDLEKVKEVGEAVVQSNQDAAHWLDRGTEHPHRIALNVRLDKVPEVQDFIRASLGGHCEARIITSGYGGWRYVDVVPINGGKLEALEYIRTLFNIPHSRCMAAGDSGNDILMLEGENLALVVGNAQQELLDWLLRQPQTGRLVRSDATLGRGILEGLARHGLY